MPQLPGGRHIAIQPESLNKLCERVKTGFRVHELMSIESREHLLNYIDILFFKPKEPGEIPGSTAQGSDFPPEDMTPYLSGFTVNTFQEELTTWPKADRVAFLAFLESAKVQKYFDELLQLLDEYKEELFRHGSLATAVQIGWWRIDCHPLQPDVFEDETGINTRRRMN